MNIIMMTMFKMREPLRLASLLLFISLSQGEEKVCREGDESCSKPVQECGVWFAESSIPHSGMGMYAGRTFLKKEPLMATGDVVVPIVDINYYQGKKFKYLWDSYTWSASALNAENEGIYDVDLASPGFGSAANSFRDLVNVDEWLADNDHAGLHRNKDPGAGAFSPYHNRESTATRRIEAGQELFVDYGGSWFKIRTEALGPIPLKGDLKRGSNLLTKFDSLRRKHNETNSAILTDLWETFVWNTSFADSSRVIFGLPKNWEETEKVIEKKGPTSLFEHRVEQSERSLKWLEKNGICMDNIREGPSTIPQAGRGAFATRDLAKDSAIAPLPLIHVTERKRLDMYELTPSQEEQFNKNNITSKQLLLNYCFGHRQSTLLLCPYGMLTALVNHGSKQRANVKLQWSVPARSSHDPTWLNMSVKDLKAKKISGLSMELVALRDIKEGEEVLLDYGDEWEAAWTRHINSWKPLNDAANYVSGEDMNVDADTKILRTEFEQMHDPYPANVQVMFDDGFRYKRKWQRHKRNLLGFKKDNEGGLYKCDILNRTEDEEGRVLYTVVYTDEEEEEEADRDTRVAGVPREGFEFKDRAYTADFLQHNVFRHDMRVPDSLFPEAWKNVVLDIDWKVLLPAESSDSSKAAT